MSILELCLGLVLIFLVFAIVVSGIQEWWAQYRGMRGEWLRIGLMRLIDDDDVFVRVLQHPLIGGLYRDRAARGKPPSYVDASSFALALASVMQRRAALLAPNPAAAAADSTLTFPALREATVALAAQKSPVADSLLPILDRANGDLAAALHGIEAWFSSGMDRVGGWYKSAAQKRIFAIGLVVAVVGNVDAIAIYRALDHEPALASELANRAKAVVDSGGIGSITSEQLQSGNITPDQAHDVLMGALTFSGGRLPIGYACLTAAAQTEGGSASPTVYDACRAELAARWRTQSMSDWLVQLIGWLITALAGTLGAPYWFGMLSKMTGIRGSGPKPARVTE
jgi:hypothetical protein